MATATGSKASGTMGRLKAEMRQAARRRGARVDPNEQAMRHVERVKAKLRSRLCSEYWVGVVAGDPAAVWGFHRDRCGTRYFPDAPCACAKCQGQRQFPSPCVGSVGVSYECWIEANARPSGPRAKPISEDEALAMGLHIIRRRGYFPKPVLVLVAGCEGCEGPRPRGQRFCLKCEAEYRAKMKDDGYLE